MGNQDAKMSSSGKGVNMLKSKKSIKVDGLGKHQANLNIPLTVLKHTVFWI
jgi:hypothetical protein